jgi:hypothetical protein
MWDHHRSRPYNNGTNGTKPKTNFLILELWSMWDHHRSRPYNNGTNGTKPKTNFLILDQTTGETSVSAGTPYAGHTAGLTTELIDLSPDNLNIAAVTPNLFIQTGRQ